MSNAMWGGRFALGPAEIMEEINASIDFDCKLAAQDIAGSEAHLAMLARQGVVDAADAEAIARGLAQIKGEIEAGTFVYSRALEDIHMNIESRLADIVGPAAGRLHTARSRNDQVAVDFRLWVRDAIDALIPGIANLQRALAARALECAGMVMPGFTHLQPAQPVTFGHHLLAYVEMLARDAGRFRDARKRLNECPLGAAALAGASFPIDREMTAKALGFDRPTANSLDSVSDRDFALEALAAAAIAATHLSRFAEEIVLWTTPQFGFVRLSDAYSTGSSIMPQKRNPDAAELVRGKTGRVVGALVGLLTVMKGLPLAYAKDMQEDKEGVFDALKTLSLCLAAMTGMVKDSHARPQADEGGGGRRLRHRHRPRRLAGSVAENAVPRGAPCHRPHRGAGRRARGRFGEAFAGRHAERRAAHHRGRLRRHRRRALGEEPRVLRRDGAGQRAEAGEGLAQAARRRVNVKRSAASFACFSLLTGRKGREARLSTQTWSRKKRFVTEAFETIRICGEAK